MGSIQSFDSNEDLSEIVKAMKNEDLLDMWVETQQLQLMMQDIAGISISDLSLPDVEKTIVHELHLRQSRP